jgi:shikimate dehydrogenase
MDRGGQGHRYLFGLIGAGIGSSLTPALHEAEADRLGLRYHYQLIDIDELGVSPGDVGFLLAEARRMGYRGLNITHPCKQAVLPYLDELSGEAAAVGAVNTVVFDGGRAIGHNTDCAGFERSFRRGLPGARMNRIVVLGAGGAGAAVARGALRLGGGHVAVIDSVGERAAGLVARLHTGCGNGRVAWAEPKELPRYLAGADGLIHATPTGMDAQPGIALSAGLLRGDLWVADVVYRPLETELLREARKLGCSTLDGGGMAVFQAALAFRLFTGVEPDAERMLGRFPALAAGSSA